jgi:exonuclease SbcD
MRIIHTSDWHIGRTFHGHSTLEHLREVLDALVALTRREEADVVVVAGDVFDSATPSADALRMFTSVLRDLRATGARIIVTSGNHDAPARLGFQSEFLPLAGIHIATDPLAHADPVIVDDGNGPTRFYCIPYLEPALVRHHWPEATLRTQADVMAFALARIRADLAEHPGSAVVVAHCFAASIESSDVEREIRVGTLDVVPLDAFEGIDYVALGHIHGRAVLAPGIRYSGAPLHYSFSEAAKPRGVWVVDLTSSGLERVEWAALPVPRQLTVLEGMLDDLLADDRHTDVEGDWVSAILTDTTRPLDAMAKLRARFPWCATLEHRPATTNDDGKQTYAERVRAAQSDLEIIDGFLGHVRNGEHTLDAERELLHEIVSEHRTREIAA